MLTIYMKGDGGGGGGGTGVVDYPAHMKTWHERALDSAGTDLPANSITNAMNTAFGSSPFITAAAYNPDTDITAYEAAIAGFAAILAGINETTEWATLFTQAATSIIVADEVVADKAIAGITDAEIVADVAAFAADVDDQITTVVLPRFQGGMRDINAVVSSTFVIGQALIEGFRDRDVAKHDSGLRVEAAKVNVNADVEEAKMNLNKDMNVSSMNLTKDTNVANIRISASDQMLRFLLSAYNWDESYARMVVEEKRIKIVAKKEENDMQIKIDEEDALWDLEVFQYGGNLLASIGSGVLNPKSTKPSGAQSMIGGALSGIAAGAMVGGPPGAIIGGILGAASGLL